MVDKAVLVGINLYKDAPLSGCVNDVEDMRDYLVQEHGFAKASIRLLVNARATAKAMRERLEWLVKDAKEDDRLVFHFSGHGTQVSDRNCDEVDGCDETLVPYDFDWDTPDTWLTDDYLAKLVGALPDRTNLVWVSDCCHSGTMLDAPKTAKQAAKKPVKAKPRTKAKKAPQVRSRYLTPPLDHEWRLQVAEERGIAPTRIKPRDWSVAFVSGCQDNQTSADAEFDGRASGALTHFLLKALRANKGMCFSNVVRQTRTALKRVGFDQIPSFAGKLTEQPFLQRA